MPRNRASKAELTKRRNEIKKLLIEGHEKTFIVDRMADQFKTSQRAIQEDIRIIGKEWAEAAEKDTKELKTKFEERLEWLFCEAAGKGHVKVALEVQKEINKINGLYKEKEEHQEKIPEIIVSRRNQLKVVNGENES